MKLRKRRRGVPTTMAAQLAATMAAQLAAASWETILRRTALMAQGTCSPAEYRRMVSEKVAAAQKSALTLMLGGTPAAILRPFHLRATRNAQRLRKG